MDFGVACDKNSYQVGPEAKLCQPLGNCNLRYRNLSEFAGCLCESQKKTGKLHDTAYYLQTTNQINFNNMLSAPVSYILVACKTK